MEEEKKFIRCSVDSAYQVQCNHLYSPNSCHLSLYSSIGLDLSHVLFELSLCCSCTVPSKVGIRPIGATGTKLDNKNTVGKIF